MQTDPAWEIQESSNPAAQIPKRTHKFSFSMLLPSLSYLIVAGSLIALAEMELDHRNLVNKPTPAVTSMAAPETFSLELPLASSGLGASKLESGEIVLKFDMEGWLAKFGVQGQTYEVTLSEEIKVSLKKIVDEANRQGKNYLALGLARPDLSAQGAHEMQVALLQNALARQLLSLGLAKEKLLQFSAEALPSEKGDLTLGGEIQTERGKKREVLLFILSEAPLNLSILDKL